MVKAVIHSEKYFRPPKNYFWHWADNGEVVEWFNGTTICYRDELIEILKELSAVGFPPVSPLLLVLYACKTTFTDEDLSFLQQCHGENTKDFYKLIDDTVGLLHIVNALPEPLKKGKPRIHLLYEIFQRSGFTFTGDRLRDIVDELNSGRIDKSILQPIDPISKDRFVEDLFSLSAAFNQFPDVGALIAKLQTGTEKAPAIADIELPEAIPKDLIDQLAEDSQTLGIARLVRPLLAALNIPLHSFGTGDQPIGGISDISNRGHFDKLLLSELAQDDVLLMARLVNNEALYFRRETPPDLPKQQRTILIDCTLKMWGLPRLFAISVAIACARNLRKGVFAKAFSLSGPGYKEIDLGSKKGVLESLGQLHHSLHCGQSLSKFITENPVSLQNEYLLITEDSLFHSPSFQSYYSSLKEALSFIITVNRDGEMQLLEIINGHIKPLNRSKFDLETLLFSAPENKEQKKGKPLLMTPPAFLSKIPSPLYFPETRIKKDPNRMLCSDSMGVFVVSETQRLLHITQVNQGASELLNYVEKGDYSFELKGTETLFFLVTNNQRKLLKFYSLKLNGLNVRTVDLSDRVIEPSETRFLNNKLYIRNYFYVYVFDCILGELVEKKETKIFLDIFKKKPFIQNEKLFEKLVDTNASMLIHVKEIYINEKNELVFGKQLLTANRDIYFKISATATKQIKTRVSQLQTEAQHPLPNNHINFMVWKWPEGSEAIVDSRGLLHLRSIDASIPEICIVMSLSRTTACWASDGNAAGNPYYINEKNSTIVPISVFYKNYIQKFIERLT